MAETDQEKLPRKVSSVFPPVILMVIVSVFLYWTFDYSETARRLPLLIGFGTVVLVVLDFISRLSGKMGDYIRFALGAGFQQREMQFEPEWRSEIKQLAWLIACLSSVVLIGILPTVPLFIFFYMFVQGRQGLFTSLLVALILVLIVWFVFEYLLEYQLYRGILFDSDGY